MSIFYLLALLAVSAAIVGVTLSSVVSVSARPVWEQPTRPQPRFEVVVAPERRTQQLPFVGQDRRSASRDDAADRPEVKLAA